MTSFLNFCGGGEVVTTRVEYLRRDTQYASSKNDAIERAAELVKNPNVERLWIIEDNSRTGSTLRMEITCHPAKRS